MFVFVDANLHSMRAALKIPQSAPPTLPDPDRWSEDFHNFMARCLVKDFAARPSAAELLTEPFVMQAPSPDVLMPMVRKSMHANEAKEDKDLSSLAAMNVNTKANSNVGADDEEDFNDSDFDNEDFTSDNAAGGTMMVNTCEQIHCTILGVILSHLI